MGPLESVILEKLGVQLTEKEKKERAVKFTALGTASGPVIAGTSGLIRGGKGDTIKNITQGARLSRWLPATMVTGALVSGAVPAIRHQIERGIVEKAKDRSKKRSK